MQFGKQAVKENEKYVVRDFLYKNETSCSMLRAPAGVLVLCKGEIIYFPNVHIVCQRITKESKVSVDGWTIPLQLPVLYVSTYFIILLILYLLF